MTLLAKTRAEDYGNRRSLVHAAFTCDQCGWLQFGAAVRDRSGTSGGAAAWDYNVTAWLDDVADLEWWPAVGVAPPFEDVPEDIAEAASEAHRCYSIHAYRGAVALARAVIEASAKAKGIKKGQLFDKIEELEKKGHIRPYVKDAAHEVRHLGNEVAHGDFVDPVTAEEADETLALMGEVLLEVFQSPARVAKVQAARKAKKAAKAAEENDE